LLYQLSYPAIPRKGRRILRITRNCLKQFRGKKFTWFKL